MNKTEIVDVNDFARLDQKLSNPATQAGALQAVASSVVEVCSECDIADCRHIRARRAATQPNAAAEVVADCSTPGVWFVRKRERDGELLDCFIAAPDCNGFAYDAEIFGDDEYREDTGMARKLADCELVCKLVNAHRAASAMKAAAVDLRNAIEFLDQMRAAAAAGEEITGTGVARDSREWLERAARAIVKTLP